MKMKLMRTPPITGPDEIRAAREANGWSVEQMADVMWVSPLEVVAWEAGSFAPSRRESGLIRWHAQMAERDRAYGPDGIQPCAWTASQAARNDTPGAHPSNLDWKFLAAHASRCDACRRAAELDAALPPIPSPIEDSATLLQRRIGALSWPYALAVHSGAAAALAGVAVLLGYAFIWLQDPTESVSLSATPFLVLMSGAEAFVLLDRPLRDTAARHPFLVGYLRTAGVLCTMLVAWLALSGVELFGDAWVWIVTGIVTVLLGYAAGEMQEDRNPPSVTSRQ